MHSKGYANSPKSIDKDCFAFIVQCIRFVFNSSNKLYLNLHESQEKYWVDVIKIANRHKVLPFVYQALDETKLRDNLNDKVDHLLSKSYLKSSQKRFQIVTQATYLIKTFTEAGIRVLPLKGPMLALQLYGKSNLRASSDIDLLIERESFLTVSTILKDLGYRCKHNVYTETGQLGINLLKQIAELGWYHPKFNTTLDLHINWFQNSDFFPLTFEQAWESARPMKIQSQVSVMMLSWEHQFLYLTAHGAKHCWSRFLWLTDIGGLLQQPDSPDWDHLFQMAKKMNLLRSCGQAICLSNRFFQTEIPQTFSHICLTRPMPYLVSEAISAMEKEKINEILSPLEFYKLLYYRSHLQNQWLYKLKCFIPLLFSPEDYELLPLPTLLLPIYFLLRPIFYIIRWSRSQ